MNGGAAPLVVWVVVGSLAAVTVVGIWAGRRTRHAGDFFIAGQRLGPMVTALATMSAAFSGFVFLGGPGLTYRLGVASFFIVLPVGVTAAMLCWVVARPLRLLAGAREIYTVSDVMRERFGGRWPAGLAAAAVVVGCVGYLGAQLQALGLVIDAVFGISGILGVWGPAAAMVVGLALVLVYAVVGGMLAGVLTDVIQGGLMMVAAAAVFVVAWRATGGPVAMVDVITESPDFGAAFLDPLGGVPVATALGFFFVFSLGTLGQPHMLHKFFMLRDPRDLRWMPLAIAGSQSVCLLIWVGIGLAVPALVATGRMAPLVAPDEATPQFLLSVAPPLVAGFVFAGVMAAIMSTADSFVNVASAALVRDLPRVFGIEVRRELPRARLAVALLLVGSAVFAGLYGDLIALLGTFAFGTFAAVLAPALAVGFNWRRVGRAAVVASMVVGLVLNLGLEFFVRFGGSLGGLPPSAGALAGSLTVLLAIGWVKPGDRDMSADVKHLLNL